MKTVLPCRALIGVVALLLSACSRQETAGSSPSVSPGPPAAVKQHASSAESLSAGPLAQGGRRDAAPVAATAPTRRNDELPPAPVSRDEVAAAAPARPATRSAPERAAELPLAVVAAQHLPGLTAVQTASLIQLSESFLAREDETVGAETNDSADANGIKPASKPGELRWRSAQMESDDRFRSMFGYSAFNAMQLKRAQDMAAEEAAGRNQPVSP